MSMAPLLLAVAAFVLLGAGAYALLNALSSQDLRKERRRLADLGDRTSAPGLRPQPRTDWAPGVTLLLRALKLHDRVQWELLRAGLLLKPSELTAVSLAAGGAALLIGRLAGRPLVVNLLAALIAMVAPWFYVVMRKGQRRQQITTQLPEALQLVASSLRSGFSILRAIDVVGKEMPPPISQEFGWILAEVNVGLSMDRAFGNMTERTQSPDVKLMVTAVQIQSKVGGNLAEVLETTATMIRERFQLAGEIGALTAEGRLSAAVLGGLPVGLALMISVVNPDYLSPLFSDPLGIALLLASGGLMLLGMVVIKSMLKIDL